MNVLDRLGQDVEVSVEVHPQTVALPAEAVPA